MSRNRAGTLASAPQTGGCGWKSAQAWARHPRREKDHFRQMDGLLHRLPWEHPSPTPAAREPHVAGSPLPQSFCWHHQTQTQPPAPLPACALAVPVGWPHPPQSGPTRLNRLSQDLQRTDSALSTQDQYSRLTGHTCFSASNVTHTLPLEVLPEVEVSAWRGFPGAGA